MSIKYPGDVSLTQIFSLIKDKLSHKVDDVDGKGLSTNDYTDEEKNKLSGIEDGANKFVHSTHPAATSGLYKVTVDTQGHVSSTSKVTKQDIVDLGIPGSNTDTTYGLATQESDGLLCCDDKKKLDGIEDGANKYTHPSHTAKTNGLYKVTVDDKGHVSGTSDVSKSDITALGIPAQDTTYNAATQSANGLMSSSDKKKLDGIATGAEVNQNAFSNVVVGNTTITADSKTDSLTLVAGSNVTITPDATNDKVTIEAKDTVYEHPTHTAKSSGLYKITVDNKGHVSAATAVTKTDITGLGIPAQDTQYTHPSHTSHENGLYKVTVDSQGHVTNVASVAKTDITGLGIPAQDTTYSDATQSTHGLMGTTDKKKLDGIAEGANKTVVDSSLSSSSTNPVQNKIINSALANKLNTSLKGAANGLAELDANGKVPTSQLPSYVDDVIEGTYVSSTSFKDASGNTISSETGKIYVDTSTNKTYRWSGTAYAEISASLALGETSSTAYRGDRGKIAYDHSNAAHARTDATKVEASSTNGKIKIDGTETTVYTQPTATSSVLGGVKIGSNINISDGKISVPTANGTTAGVTIVYPAASCTTFSSDSGTVTPLAVQKGAKMFAITRPSATTNKAITRYSNTTGDVQDSKIIIEDVTNSRDTSKNAQVIAIPAEGGKKMVYGYCTDQVDGTSFIGGIFDADATEYPYSAGLAIGGTTGNLLWKGTKVATVNDIPSVPVKSVNGKTGAVSLTASDVGAATMTQVNSAIATAITGAIEASY